MREAKQLPHPTTQDIQWTINSNKVTPDNMGIYLRCLNIVMAQQFLQIANIAT
ncbi:hypothetical protein O59_002666 [Cellvibrio sp. BR]|nr:hypothetical protein O59_002666 [Cellvibrio sp. BR]